MGSREVYGLSQKVPLVGCRPCVVKDCSFAEYYISVGPREEMVILYQCDNSVFYEFDRVPGFVIIKCVSSQLKELQLRYFAVAECEWRNFYRFGVAKQLTVQQKISKAVERLTAEQNRGKLWKVKMGLLLTAYDILLATKKLVQRAKIEGATAFFQIWFRYYMSWISAKHLNPKLEFPLSLILVKRKVWDRCMARLECRRLYLRYGDRVCCR